MPLPFLIAAGGALGSLITGAGAAAAAVGTAAVGAATAAGTAVVGAATAAGTAAAGLAAAAGTTAAGLAATAGTAVAGAAVVAGAAAANITASQVAVTLLGAAALKVYGTSKEAQGHLAGKKEGVAEASEQYEQKIVLLTQQFLEQKKVMENQLEEYEMLLDVYGSVIKELEAKVEKTEQEIQALKDLKVIHYDLMTLEKSA